MWGFFFKYLTWLSQNKYVVWYCTHWNPASKELKIQTWISQRKKKEKENKFISQGGNEPLNHFEAPYLKQVLDSRLEPEKDTTDSDVTVSPEIVTEME